jgi:UDPglucose 6-dehydrogenase
LLQTAIEAGVQQRIVSTVVAVNDERKASMAARVADALGGSLTGKKVGVLGLAFKPNTDDMRDAPSIQLVTGLLARGAIVSAYDPVASEQARSILPEVQIAESSYAAAADADAVVLITEWDEFRALDLRKMSSTMSGNVLVDLRNVYDRADAEEAGLRYFPIGRGQAPAPTLTEAA